MRKSSGRSFGKFECDSCGHSWFSGWTWKNYSQDCNRCGNVVDPSSRAPLKFSGKESTAEHPAHLCHKCKALGRPCNY